MAQAYVKHKVWKIVENVSFRSEFFGSEFVNSERCRVISTGQTIFAWLSSEKRARQAAKK